MMKEKMKFSFSFSIARKFRKENFLEIFFKMQILLILENFVEIVLE